MEKMNPLKPLFPHLPERSEGAADRFVIHHSGCET
jgi:hypothetical protein